MRTARDMIRTATSLGMLEGDGAARTFSGVVMSDDLGMNDIVIIICAFADYLAGLRNDNATYQRIWRNQASRQLSQPESSASMLEVEF